jgi:hypothetical protein
MDSLEIRGIQFATKIKLCYVIISFEEQNSGYISLAKMVKSDYASLHAAYTKLWVFTS